MTVRPERIRLMPEENDSENCVVGTVCDVIYLGRTRKYIVRMQEDTEIVIYQNEHDSSVGIPALGERIRLGWKADDATALPDVNP
jgi:putative spermidine/putrescine transport system ATP-binding protein